MADVTIAPMANAEVGAQVCVWFICAVASSITSKHLHKHFNVSSLVQTTIQMMGMYLCCRVVMRRSNVKMISVKYRLPLMLVTSIMRISGLLFSQLSLVKMSLSFSQTVKALGPLVMVIITRVFLKKRYPMSTYIAVAFIVLGVLIASANETSYDVVSFMYAMVSTTTLVSLSILSKKLMSDGLHPCVVLAATTRFSICFALILVLGEAWNGNLIQEEEFDGIPLSLIFHYALNVGAYTVQCISAITVLQSIQPLSYSIANIAKRICVVVTSLIIFQNEVSFMNVLGMIMTMSAVCYYNVSQSLAKTRQTKLDRLDSSSRGATIII